MSFTRISELTRNAATGSIENGKGLYFPGNTFFYAEDIKKVLAQAEMDPDVRLSQLMMVNVIFEKTDGLNNHDIHMVKVLALAKGEPQRDEQGRLFYTDWYDIVALPWPPYYDPESTNLSNNDQNSPYEGKPFSGSPSYKPGFETHK